MRPWWKAGGLALLVVALVWLVSAWRWQSSGRDVGGTELLLQLVVLPLVLTGVLLVSLRVARAMRMAPDISAAGAPASSLPSGALQADHLQPDAERTCSAVVASVAVELPVPGEAAQAVSTMLEGVLRPGPDAELSDFDGLPIFCARINELDVETSLPPSLRDEAPVHVQRSWALLDKVLTHELMALSDALVPLADADMAEASLPSSMPTMKAHLSGVAHPAAVQATQAIRRPHVLLLCAVPAQWNTTWQDALHAWLKMRTRDLLPEVGEMDLQIQLLPAEAAHELWSAVDGLLLQWVREPMSGRRAAVLVVADSAVDAEVVERWQGRGELFTSAHQVGRIPGEAGVGLLLLHEQWPGLSAQTPLARLHRPVRQIRDKSADALGRIGHVALLQAMTQAVQITGHQAESLNLVVSDGDHRASRTSEVFEAVLALFPDLDPMQGVARAGDSCGDPGLAAAWLPLALAAGALPHRSPEGLTLAVQVQPSHHRAAVALAPWRAPAMSSGVPT